MKDKIIFLPLLMIYLLIVLVANTDYLWGDEGRYIQYATNLLNGYYSPHDKILLENGPGYPIILMPFVKLKLPWLTAKLLNAIFLFMAIIYFYHMLRIYIKERSAIFFSYLLGIYYPFLRCIHLLVTEALAILLVCGFSFHLCKLYRDGKYHWAQLMVSSVYLGYLALTKVFFGYVILIGLLMFLFLYLWKKKDAYKKTFLVYLIALLCCIPYLFYTYSLTGKIFYWGTAGGQLLYLMSSPYAEELGDWHARDSKNNQEFYGAIWGLSAIEKDNVYKKQAIKNIINHPVKFILNWVANVGRLAFNYPFSYDTQKLSSYFYMIPNMFLIVFCILCLYPAYLGRRLIPFEIYVLIFFALISFGGLSIISSDNRYSWPLVPVLMLWISFTFARLVKVEIRR